MKLPPAMEQHDQPRERLSDEMRRRIKDELVEANRLADRRNRIVHGLWLPAPGSTGDDWINLRLRRYQLLMPQDHITTEEILDVAQQADQTARRIARIGSNVDHRLYGLVAAPGWN